MHESIVTTKSKDMMMSSRLGRWAYTPRRPLLFFSVECWAILTAELLALFLDAGVYPSALLHLAAVSTGALLVNRALRRPEEERVLEAFQQDIAVLEQLGLPPDCTEKEKVRLFHVYIARMEKARSLDR